MALPKFHPAIIGSTIVGEEVGGVEGEDGGGKGQKLKNESLRRLPRVLTENDVKRLPTSLSRKLRNQMGGKPLNRKSPGRKPCSPSPTLKISVDDLPKNLQVNRSKSLITLAAIRFVGMLELLLRPDPETGLDSCPRPGGRSFKEQDFTWLVESAEEAVSAPVEKYLEDLQDFLVNELLLGGLVIKTKKSGLVPLAPEHEKQVRTWLRDRLDKFHKPYRIG